MTRWLLHLGRASVILGMTCAVAHPVSAQLARVGGEFAVNTYTIDNQHSSRVAGLADEGFVVTWTSSQQDGDAGGIFGRRFGSGGRSSGSEFQVNTTTVGSQLAPRIAAAPDGTFLVVWATFADSPVVPSIEARRFDSQAVPIQDEFTVSDEAYSDVFSPNVTANEEGEFVVVWGFDSNGQYLIRGQALDNDGQFNGPPFVVSDGSTDRDHVHPAIASGNDSSFMVVWYASFGSAVGGRTFEAPDEPGSLEFRVDGDAVRDRTLPQICSYQGGDFAVAWTGHRDHFSSSDQLVKYRRYGANGTPKSDQILIAGDASEQGGPSVACRGGAETVVAWDEVDGIHGRYFPDGPPFEFTEFRIAASAERSRFAPSVAMLGSTQFILTWTDCGPSDCDVLGQRFALLGPTACPGDCNVDAIVSVDELIIAVNLALGSGGISLSACLPVDTDLNYSVSVDEIVKAVSRALEGCP